jgi:hypothetical protein
MKFMYSILFVACAAIALMAWNESELDVPDGQFRVGILDCKIKHQDGVFFVIREYDLICVF